ncbi:MAG: hypothetical protein ABL952_01395 [Pyrinomonadaceae bacterium]
MHNLLYRISLFVLLLPAVLTIGTSAQEWRPVSGGSQGNISGMALIAYEKQNTTLLVVHDNKKPEQIRATLFSINGTNTPTYTPLKWLGDDLPIDLEAMSPVPGVTGQFMALASAGRVYHVKLDRRSNSIETLKAFDLPMIPNGADFEGFDLQTINGQMVAVWGERGDTQKAATLFWSKFDLDNYKFSDVGWESFRVPYPLTNVRHISDIKVDASGGIFVTAASDPGDAGPFSSAAYFAGAFLRKR